MYHARVYESTSNLSPGLATFTAVDEARAWVDFLIPKMFADSAFGYVTDENGRVVYSVQNSGGKVVQVSPGADDPAP